MTFGEALAELKFGMCVWRTSWPENVWISIAKRPGEEYCHGFGTGTMKSLSSYPVADMIGILTPQGTYEAWNPSHADLLADDWKTLS